MESAPFIGQAQIKFPRFPKYFKQQIYHNSASDYGMKVYSIIIPKHDIKNIYRCCVNDGIILNSELFSGRSTYTCVHMLSTVRYKSTGRLETCVQYCGRVVSCPGGQYERQ